VNLDFKMRMFDLVIGFLSRHFELVPMRRHCGHILNEPRVASRPLPL
jgi:hypothetical protein